MCKKKEENKLSTNSLWLLNMTDAYLNTVQLQI